VELAKALGNTDGSTTAGSLIFGLHAVNGLAILAVAGVIVRQARTLSRSTTEASVAQPAN
jgi:hypothetical protein